jgi:hypothetical protein
MGRMGPSPEQRWETETLAVASHEQGVLWLDRRAMIVQGVPSAPKGDDVIILERKKTALPPPLPCRLSNQRPPCGFPVWLFTGMPSPPVHPLKRTICRFPRSGIAAVQFRLTGHASSALFMRSARPACRGGLVIERIFIVIACFHSFVQSSQSPSSTRLGRRKTRTTRRPFWPSRSPSVSSFVSIASSPFVGAYPPNPSTCH